MWDVDQTEENRRFLLDEALTRLDEQPTPEVLDVCYHHRAIAVCCLLGQADSRGFAEHLARSGQVRLAFLRSREAATSDARLKCISNDLGVDAALAAGELQLALEITRASTSTRLPDVEYADTFLVRRAQHELVKDLVGGGGDDVAQIAKSLEEDGDDAGKAWAALVLAVHSGAVEPFDAAFEALADQRSAKFEELATTPGFSKEVRSIEASVWIHGLAWLRLADLRGLDTRKDYRLAPKISRVSVTVPRPQDSWRRID